MHGFFSEFYEPPDIQKSIFALWYVPMSEVYVTGINF